MKPIQPYLVVGSAFILLMAFQNCAPSTKLAAMDTSGSETVFSKTSVDEFRSIVITDPDSANALDVDIDNGEVREIDRRGVATGERFCLKSEDKAALEEVLKGAELCEPVAREKLEQQCTMIYQFPYAELKNSSLQVRLGEKMGGCDIPADLCGEKSAELRQLAVELLAKIPESSCE